MESCFIFMKKLIFSLILVSFLFGISFVSTHALDEKQNLPSPGITPDSSLYFLKEWKEKIQLFFTLNAENKAKQYLHLAEVRLAEYQKMIDKGKTEIAEKTLAKYEKQLDKALAKVEELKQKGKDVKDISQKLEEKIAKHTEVLEQNLQKVPEAGKKGIEKALDASSKVLEKVKGPKNGKSNLIEVFTPKSNAVIKSPLSIEGKARGTWFFEGSFPIKLLDGNGKEIATTAAQAQGEWMTENFVNFKSTLEFTKPQTEKGTLVFEKDNPSGLSEKADELRVSVVFIGEPEQDKKESLSPKEMYLEVKPEFENVKNWGELLQLASKYGSDNFKKMYLSQEAQQMSDAIKEGLVKMTRDFNRPDNKIKEIQERITGDTAVVFVSFLDTETKEEITMIREKNIWKIDGFNLKLK